MGAEKPDVPTQGETTSLVDKSEYGEPVKYDPTFNGPIKNRSCTDVICCLIFVLFFLAFLIIGIWAFAMGDPRILLYPTDSEGNICGYGDFEGKPYVFFFDLLDCAQVGVGVLAMGCPTPQSIQELVEDELCAPYYLESKALVGRCVPTFIKELADNAAGIVQFNNTGTVTDVVDKFGNAVNGTDLEKGVEILSYFLNAKEYGMKIFQDVRASWWLILLFLCLGGVITFIWIILMRWIAGPIVWLTIIIFIGLFAFGTWYCYDKWDELKNSQGYISSGELAFTTNLSYYSNLTETWLAFFIICLVFLVIIVILIIFLRKRICIAIALIKESSRAVGSMIFTLFWPLFPMVLQVVIIAYWGSSALFLASIGDKTYGASNNTIVNVTNETTGEIISKQKVISELIQDIPCDPNDNSTSGTVCSFIKYGGEYTIYLQIFQLFMWFWIMNFIVALGQIVLAGAFASYYWAWDKSSDIPAFPVAASLYRALRYHLGSIAFGSLIIAIIQMIRVMLEYVDHKLKSSENKVAKFILKCLKCCFWCLEKFMKFINKNAYILIAVYGNNFCTSAKNAFMLIMRNIVRVAVVDKVTDFLIFIGKLMVVGVIGVLSFYFFSGDLSASIPWTNISDYIASFEPELNYYLVPVIIIAIGTYVIASGFFSVYSMAVDTLFLCFLEDLERHDGSAEKPYYMSQELKNILGKKNTPPPTAGGDDEGSSKGCCGCC